MRFPTRYPPRRARPRALANDEGIAEVDLNPVIVHPSSTTIATRAKTIGK
jgi:hypothetical protein